MLPSKCNKKHATNQGAMKIDDDDVCEMIEEVYRRDKFHKEFNIGSISEYKDDESISEDEEESSGDNTHWSLLVLTFVLYDYDTKVINLLWYFFIIDYYNINLNIMLILLLIIMLSR